MLLGVSLGIRAIEAEDARQTASTWLSDLVGKAISAAPPGDWNASLIRTAVAVLTSDATTAGVAPEMIATLAARGVFPAEAVSREAAWQAATIPDPADEVLGNR